MLAALALAAVLAGRTPVTPKATPSTSPPVDPQAQAALDRFFAAAKPGRALTYTFDKSERLEDGRVVHGAYTVKQRLPHTLYVRSPNGREILFVPEKDPFKLWVNPGAFPFVTLRPDYREALATKDEHHVATHMGFTYFAQVLRRALEAAKKANTGERIAYDGKSKVNGLPVRLVILYAGHAAPEPRPPKPGETLLQFGERVAMDPYWIAYEDPTLPADLSGVLPQDRPIGVPRYYGKKVELAFDEASNLPIRQLVWDDAGHLYEQYLYDNLRVDAPLGEADFDPTSPGYGF